jgi:GNAT superfamily N-acetyltransferase
MSDISIRVGTESDLPALLELIRELAVFENAGDEVSNTVNRMREEGFGQHPIYGFFIAEIDNTIIGCAIYYWRYSTWKGKRLYLEDLIITEKQRGIGAGQLLFDQLQKFGKTEGCSGMMWQVLDWNKSAIKFYEKYDTHFDGEWINCNVDF